MTVELASTDTTAGACTLCAARAPAGMGALRAGAVVFGAGVAGGIGAWALRAAPLASAIPFGAGAILGLPLLAFGVRKALNGPRPFVTGTLAPSDGGVVPAGGSIDVRVTVAPDHALYVQAATLELIALEIDAHGTERVLNVLSVPFAPGTRIDGPLEKTQAVSVPRDWPVTMASPHQKGVSSRRVETRLRLSLDFAAHPLFALEAMLVISAPK